MTKKAERKSPAAERAHSDALGTNEVKGLAPETRDLTRKPGGIWARVRGLFNRPRPPSGNIRRERE